MADHLAATPPQLTLEVDFPHDPLASAYRTLVLGSLPYAWARLQEASGTALADASGNARTITLASAGNNTYSRPGATVLGEAADLSFKFTGANQITMPVTNGGNNAHDAGLTGGASIEMWIYMGASYPAAVRFLFGDGVGISYTPALKLGTDGRLTWDDNSAGTTTVNGSAGNVASAAGVVALNAWNHVVVVVEGTNAASKTYIYLNGVAVASGTDVANASPTANTPLINNMAAGTYAYFGWASAAAAFTYTDGEIDEPAFYAYPLTSTDVLRHYVNRTSNYYTADTYTDLSKYARGAQVTRGRQTILDRIEAGTMGSELLDPDRRFEPEYTASPYYPYIIPIRKTRLRAAIRSGIPGTPATVSGNEVTDALRSAGLSGDGRAAEGSYGIWEATTNLLLRGNAFDHASWVKAGLTVVANDAADPYGNLTADRVTVTTAATDQISQTIAVTAGQVRTFSFWVKRGTTTDLKYRVRNATAGTDIVAATSYYSQTNASTFVRISVTYTVPAGCTQVDVLPISLTSAVGTSWLWRAQDELQPLATAYVDTTSTSVTRATARVQQAASVINATQGWFAARVRVGWASTADPHGGNGLAVFFWGDNVNNRLHLFYSVSADQWQFVRVNAGTTGTTSSAAQTFAAGSVHVVDVAWESGRLRISVDGGAFVNVNDTNIPTLAATLFDVGTGTVLGAARELDGEVLWTATGTGPRTDAQAATLNTLAAADANLGLIDAAMPTAVVTSAWSADDTRTEIASATTDLFTGYVEDWPIKWSPRRAYTDLTAFDALAALADWPISGSFPVETTSARVNRVLDLIGWPATLRLIDAGAESAVAATLTDGSALEHLRLMETTENGILYVDASGNIVFRNRDHRIRSPRSLNVQFTLGDGGPATTELPYVTVVPEFSYQRVVNQVIVTWYDGGGGHTVKANDYASQQKYGNKTPKSVQRDTALTTAAAALAQANAILTKLSVPKLRFVQVEIDPARHASLYAALIPLKISDRVLIVRRPQGLGGGYDFDYGFGYGGAAISRECFVERIEHAANAGSDRRWRTTLGVSAAT